MNMLEHIPFSTFSKLSFSIPEPEDLLPCRGIEFYLEESLTEWRDKFLCYKTLKKLLKRFPSNPNNDQFQTPAQNDVVEDDTDPVVGTSSMRVDPRTERSLNSSDFHDWFVRLLNEELEKLNDFYMDKGGIRHQISVVQVETLHVNSLVLAASSPFFYKLFKNEMRESQQRDVTLKVNASDDVAALKDVLKFIYSNTMSATTTAELLDVLLAADKFEVSSCLNYCSLLLQKMPMSLESALLFLDLPTSVSESEVVQPLIVSTKEYLAERYSNFDESKEEVMGLPLCALEVVLGSDGLQVDSEDYVFDFVLKWASAHYPIMEERREIIAKRLVQYIWFPYMSYSKLKETLSCPEFGHEKVSKLVFEALLSKAEVHYLQHKHASKDLATTNWSSLGRFYKYRPVKVVQLCFSQPRCVVYFDLKKEECENLSPSRDVHSEPFYLGGQEFCLMAVCRVNKKLKSFGLCVYKAEGSESCTLDYEFAVIKKSSMEFERKVKDNSVFNINHEGWGFLFEMSWIDFMSEYFIDGILHLRADLTIKH